MSKPTTDLQCSAFIKLFFFFLWPCSLAITSTGRAGLWFCVDVQEHPKAQSAVVLVLKRLRRRGHGLKSHPKDWEKPGIETCDPWFTRQRFIPYITAASSVVSL